MKTSKKHTTSIYKYLSFVVAVVGVWMFGGLFNLSKASSAQQHTIKISVTNIEGLLEKSRTGLPYNRILDAINDRSSANILFYFDNSSRSAANFNYKVTDCLFPANLVVNAVPDEAKIESESINTAKAYFVSKELVNAKQLINDQTKSYIIGFKRGNTFGGNIKKLEHHRLISLTSDTQAAKMLSRDRIDIMIAYFPDASFVLQGIEFQHFQYDENAFFYSQEDKILCHQTPSNEAFMLQANQIIQAMKLSGELKEILEK